MHTVNQRLAGQFSFHFIQGISVCGQVNIACVLCIGIFSQVCACIGERSLCVCLVFALGNFCKSSCVFSCVHVYLIVCVLVIFIYCMCSYGYSKEGMSFKTDSFVFFHDLTLMRFIAVNGSLIMFYYKICHNQLMVHRNFT